MAERMRFTNELRDDYERRLQQALDAEEPSRLLQPGGRHNTSAIPVSDKALVALLALAQQGMVLANCQVPDCENCNEHRLIWWDCCNALARNERIALQSQLVASGYGLPDAPWEDIDTVDNGVQRNWTLPRP